MKRKVMIHEDLRLTLSEIGQAIANVGNDEYTLDVVVDDGYNYIINPKGIDSGKYREECMDENGQVLCADCNRRKSGI